MSKENSARPSWRPTVCVRASGSGDLGLINAVDELLEHLKCHWGGTVATVAHAVSSGAPMEEEQWSTSSIEDSQWRSDVEGQDHSTVELSGDLWRVYASSHTYRDVPQRIWLVSVGFRVSLDEITLGDEDGGLLSTIDFMSNLGSGFQYAKAHPGEIGAKLRPMKRGRFRGLPSCFRFLPWITIISSSRLDSVSRELLLAAPAHRVVTWKGHVLVELFDFTQNPTPLEMDEAQTHFVDYIRLHDGAGEGPSPWARLSSQSN